MNKELPDVPLSDFDRGYLYALEQVQEEMETMIRRGTYTRERLHAQIKSMAFDGHRHAAMAAISVRTIMGLDKEYS